MSNSSHATLGMYCPSRVRKMITEKPQAETSMDEILASIRKIISADSESGIHVENPSFFSSEESEDILDLTDVLPEESIKAPPQVASDIHINDLGEWSPYANKAIYFEETEKKPYNTAKSASVETNPSYEATVTSSFEEPLLSQTTMSETTQAFHLLNKLAQEIPPSSEPRLSESMGGQTLENLMREMLKPLLKEWLDAHLPALVRSVVTQQVEKIVGQKRHD